jgi:DNA-binding NarL/FixJ family response regulator
MLRSIIADTIATQPDMQIVGNGLTAAGLAKAAESTNADVVILASDGLAGDEESNEILYGRSRPKVIEISDQGRNGSLYELRPCRVPLGEMSPPRLLETIRGAVERGVEAD